MKKLFYLCILLNVFYFISCNNYQTKPFKITNDSDWDVAISITNFNEMGTKQSYSNYIIIKHSSEVFYLYNNGNCELISVNGAKIFKKTSSELNLKNDKPKKIRIINLTGEDILLSNIPALPCPLNDRYASPEHYIPLFTSVIITKSHSSQALAKEIDIYAWQIEFCKNDKDLNLLPIGIKTDTKALHIFRRINDNLYLILF